MCVSYRRHRIATESSCLSLGYGDTSRCSNAPDSVTVLAIRIGIQRSSLSRASPVLGLESIFRMTGSLRRSLLRASLCAARRLIVDSASRYIYRLFLGADGNHSLHKKTKPGDDSDYSLVGNRGFFNDTAKLPGVFEVYPKDTASVVRISFLGGAPLTPSPGTNLQWFQGCPITAYRKVQEYGHQWGHCCVLYPPRHVPRTRGSGHARRGAVSVQLTKVLSVFLIPWWS